MEVFRLLLSLELAFNQLLVSMLEVKESQPGYAVSTAARRDSIDAKAGGDGRRKQGALVMREREKKK